VITDAEVLSDLEKYASENDIIADPKAASKHWSGEASFIWYCTNLIHPLDGETYPLKARKIHYAVDYHATSAYVHDSLAAIEHLLPSDNFVYEPEMKPRDDEGQSGQKTLYIIVRYIHLATRYAMFGMEIEKTETIDEEHRRILSALKPIVRRHKPESTYRRIF
jgi:hypothetical protein